MGTPRVDEVFIQPATPDQREFIKSFAVGKVEELPSEPPSPSLTEFLTKMIDSRKQAKAEHLAKGTIGG